MSWWTEEITHEIAVQFLEELQAFTTKMLKVGPPDLRYSRFSHVIPRTIKPFVPRGAVISTTESHNGWNALRAVNRQNFGIHFLIANQEPKFGHSHGFKFITELPTTILMPMGYDSIVEHGAFLSDITWGIDIRNIGMLRPFYSPIGGQPTPIFAGEERLGDFRMKNPSKVQKFYWWNNLWREEFTHNVTRIRDYHYESVSIRQIRSLVILLRVLHAYMPLDPNFVVPSNCVSGMSPVMPMIDWKVIRDLVFKETESEVYIDEFSSVPSQRGFDQDLGRAMNSDDVYIEDLCRRHHWRNESEGQNLGFFDNHETVGEFQTIDEEAHYISCLRDLGYHVEYNDNSIDIAAKMFMMSLRKTGTLFSEIRHLIDKYHPILLK